MEVLDISNSVEVLDTYAASTFAQGGDGSISLPHAFHCSGV